MVRNIDGSGRTIYTESTANEEPGGKRSPPEAIRRGREKETVTMKGSGERERERDGDEMGKQPERGDPFCLAPGRQSLAGLKSPLAGTAKHYLEKTAIQQWKFRGYVRSYCPISSRDVSEQETPLATGSWNPEWHSRR